MQESNLLPKAVNESSCECDHFVKVMAELYGQKKMKTWHNNNHTIKQKAYVLDMKDADKTPAKIYATLSEFNRTHQQHPIVAVPVAGWDEKPKKIEQLNIFSEAGRKEQLTKEYAQSFSLSDFTTAKNASLILRVSKEGQKMEAYKENGKYYFRTTPGVRITDADEYLFYLKMDGIDGFALPTNMSTIHTITFTGGTANGAYGPARDDGAMSTKIHEMTVKTADGKELKLSKTENPEVFAITHDCHLGACYYVKDIVFEIEPKFLMKRHNVLLKDVEALEQSMNKSNPLDEEHFILMYIPTGMNKDGDHLDRIRVTTSCRTNEVPEKLHSQEQKDLTDFLSLEETNLSEPLINLVTKHKKLRKYFPYFLDAAVLKTYGTEKETFEIDWSHRILHIFGTYTENPIVDYNFLIQVENSDDARQLLLVLLKYVEQKLKEEGNKEDFVLLNGFARYLKGILYPEGQEGIAPTAVEPPYQNILSFELVTFLHLAKTPAFKALLDGVVNCLNDLGRKFNYHPGKTMPDNIRSLEQIFTDATRQRGLENFKEMVYKLHGGKDNIPFSPFLTPQKKEFIGLSPYNIEQKEEMVNKPSLSKEKEIKVVKEILKYAQKDEVNNAALIKRASKHLKNSVV